MEFSCHDGSRRLNLTIASICHLPSRMIDDKGRGICVGLITESCVSVDRVIPGAMVVLVVRVLFHRGWGFGLGLPLYIAVRMEKVIISSSEEWRVAEIVLS